MTITFARATPADAETLVAVQIASFHNDAVIYPGVAVDGPPGYDSVATALQKINEAEYFKILADDQIIGGMVIYIEGEGHYHLDLIYLHPDFHNQGIGTQAMHFIEQLYPATKWTLHTPKYALRNQHFYEKFGYIKVGEEEHPDIILYAYEKHV